jgi:hypothetical protein
MRGYASPERRAEAIASVVVAILLLVAAESKESYGFYVVLRLVCTAGAVYWALRAYQEGLWGWIWAFATVALLMNPFIPIRMQRKDWQSIDLWMGVLLLSWSGYWLLRRVPQAPAERADGTDAPGELADSKAADHQIELVDVKAISVYCRHLAKEWWKGEQRQVAICDTCNSPVLCDDGFLNDTYLQCDSCFTPSSAPSEALQELREDPDYFGETTLADARRFVGMRPRH